MSPLEFAVQRLRPDDWTLHCHTFDGKAVWWKDGGLTDRGRYFAHATHECGAIAELEITPSELMRMGIAKIDVAITHRLYSCYCVRREVIVPCTFQRCDGTP